jgi:hypothetical protein
VTDDVGARGGGGEDADAPGALIELGELFAQPALDGPLRAFGEPDLLAPGLVNAMAGDNDDRRPRLIDRAAELGDDRLCKRGLDPELGEEFQLALGGPHEPWSGRD